MDDLCSEVLANVLLGFRGGAALVWLVLAGDLLLGSGDISPVILVSLSVETVHGTTYHSLLTFTLLFVHVVDEAIAASILGLPFVCRSPTASAAQNALSKLRVTSRV